MISSTFKAPLVVMRPPKRPISGIKVSAVMITFNESKNIRRTLSKLSWCDEIIVVDSYSTDDTVALCTAMGCKVFYRAFDGYGPQKQYAVSKAKNDWVLCLDADEVLSDALVDEITEELANGTTLSGYTMPMNLVFLNREFRYGRESGRHFLRLFNRRKGGVSGALVHEGVQLRGKTGQFRNSLRHYSYTSLSQWYEKCNRYTNLAAEEAFKKGKRKSLGATLIALPYYFFLYYFINLNFLNGREGFYWSIYSAQYHFTKYLKIMERYKKER